MHACRFPAQQQTQSDRRALHLCAAAASPTACLLLLQVRLASLRREEEQLAREEERLNAEKLHQLR